jgi:large subunit ribosomal protein L22
MEFTAKLNYVRVSPQKARLVLELIKGRRVEQALDTLMYDKHGISPKLYKLLRSALENANYQSAEKGLDVDVDRLYVKRAIANEGPRMKRIRPAPMGRAFRYQRRLTHIIVSVAERAVSEGLVTKVDEAQAKATKSAKKSTAKTATKSARKSTVKAKSAA